jgi:hypothetical protein
MGMGTHTITSVGLVDNSNNSKVMRSIILLEKELKEVAYQIKACHEHDMDAFLSFFRDEWTRIEKEIRSLLYCLHLNIVSLIS